VTTVVLSISKATAYCLAKPRKLPSLFEVGAQHRIFVPGFWCEVHGGEGASAQ
jgi:hypothetical protein